MSTTTLLLMLGAWFCLLLVAAMFIYLLSMLYDIYKIAKKLNEQEDES